MADPDLELRGTEHSFIIIISLLSYPYYHKGVVRRTFLESCKEPADMMMEDVLLPKWLQIMINERTSTK